LVKIQSSGGEREERN